MNRLFLYLSGFLLLAACGGPAETPAASPASPVASSPVQAESAVTQTESARLNLWFDEKNEQRLQFSPLELTSLGRKDRYDEIDDLSLEATQAYVDWFNGTVEELQASFNYEQLDFETRTSFDLWVYSAEQAAAALQWHNQDYVFNQMSGAHTDLPTLLISYHTVATGDEMQAYISRVRGVGRAVRQALVNAQSNAAYGVRPPRFSYEAVLEQSRKLITGRPFTNDTDEAAADSVIFADGKTKIAALLEAGIVDQVAATRLTDELSLALQEAFAPAYEDLIAWFETDLPNSQVQARGVSSLPDGNAFYAYALEHYTTLPLTAEQLHATGLAEVQRINGEMQRLKEEIGFDGDMADLKRFLQTDEQFFFPNTDEGRQGYLDDSGRYLDHITEKLPQYFGILPKAPLEVRRVEPFREQDGAAQHYMGGSVDGSRPGIYYVHLSDTRTMPKTEMEAIAYHEGLPGHHMQISIAQELSGLPAFRTQFSYTAYVEGWALYAEQLAGEMGAYENPYLKYGQLTLEMWRAVRLVVDTGLHNMGWSEQQAIDYFAANASTPLPAITSEVRRYLVLPGQATSYKTGMLKILELRQLAQDQLGENFDIREFHDVVLGGGALPLAILEKRVQNWLADK